MGKKNDNEALLDRLSTFIHKDSHYNVKRACIHCKHTSTSSGGIRVLCHVTGEKDPQDKKSIAVCPHQDKFDPSDVALARAILQRKRAAAAAAASATALQKARDASAGFQQGGIRAHLTAGVGPKRKADDSVANWLYEQDMPPATTSSPAFREMMAAVSAHGPGYVAPDRHNLLGGMLDRSQEQMTELLQPCIRQEKLTGCCLETDGMTNVQKIPIINFMVSSPAGGRFLKIYDTTGQVRIYGTWLTDESLMLLIADQFTDPKLCPYSFR
jgi:hypothetical protein